MLSNLLMITIRCQMLTLLLLCVGSSLVSAAPPVNVDSAFSRLNLNPFVAYTLDHSNSLDATNIDEFENWQTNPSAAPVNLGFSEFEVWIRLRFEASSALDNATLALPYPLLEDLTVYFQNSQGEMQRLLRFGYLGPNQQDNRFPVLQLPAELVDGGTVFISAKSSTSLQLPLELWQPEHFIANERTQIMIWGGYLGLLAALLVYNFFLLLSTVDRQYLFYVLYLGSVIGVMLAISGLDKVYLWPGDPQYSITLLSVSTLLSCIFGLMFARALLFENAVPSVINQIFRFLMGSAAVLLVVALAWHDYGARFAGVWSGAAMLFVIYAGAYALQQGVVVARYFMAAWLLFCGGLALYLLSVFGVVASTDISSHALQFGSAAEVLLLSFALAYRIKEDRRRRMKALEQRHQMAEKMKAVELQALERATRDPVTSVANEFPLIDRMQALMRSKQAEDNVFAVLYFRLPQCRGAIFSLGRSVAESLFRMVVTEANDYLQTARNTVRLERDRTGLVCVPEFGSVVCLVRSGQGDAGVQHTAEALRGRLSRAYEVNGISIHSDAFCGIAFYPTDCDSPMNLLQRAGSACESGMIHGDPITVYHSSIELSARRRLQLIASLAEALESQEITVVLQPQVDILNYQVIGAEVLARWHSPRHGDVPPDEFVKLAESANLIDKLTSLIIDRSFECIRQINKQTPGFNISINISVHNLTRPGFAAHIVSKARAEEIDLSQVTFEVTESTLIENMSSVLQNLNHLVQHGARLSLDDFGTGYSSFSYLSQLPIHELKVDREFVKRMREAENDASIIATIMKLAKTLQLETVVEGIEDSDTLEQVAKLGADRVQGYYFGKPMTLERFLQSASRPVWVSGLAKSPAALFDKQHKFLR
ncbi:EAL domain-containing protein [Allohahella marinimesophila]|uniref:EAL domain-containing protein n=1 Tax=Allohahella marinimesophila TaxID=1054972 RepID=A0ABP7NXP9_9GAMM